MDTETTETVETEETETDAVEAPEEVNTEEVVEDPTAGLKTALQKERAARKAAEKRSRELEQERADRDKSADEKALDDARRDAAAEATAKANKRLIAAEFRSAAAKRVKDPRIAAKLVDLEGIEVDDDGEVDADGIAAALDAVLEEYPDLAPSRFEGTADQGARGKAAAPSQLTRDDLKNMTPQAILKADKEGRLDRLKGKTK
ncbi:hypothetical protein ACF07D_07400 [Leucobacter sp. NPDC015123]|uniref:hypothetical protein n=1 Tax=Leucobacter sp. NPDC015123 TaxID=3364129 RepID=UPI0036F4998C